MAAKKPTKKPAATAKPTAKPKASATKKIASSIAASVNNTDQAPVEEKSSTALKDIAPAVTYGAKVNKVKPLNASPTFDDFLALSRPGQNQAPPLPFAEKR
jgi:hypothetical protein